MERRVRAGGRVGGALSATLVLLATAGACTAGSARPPRPTTEKPTFTTIAEAPVSPRLDAPARARGEVSRLSLRLTADGGFEGSAKQSAVTRTGVRYRLTGRCLQDEGGGVLVVDVMGPIRAGAADGAPSEPMLGDAVASATIPCDGVEAVVDLPPVPPGASELAPNPRTTGVAAAWVLLSVAS